MGSTKLGIMGNNVIVPYTAASNMPAGTIISYSGSIASFTTTAVADSTNLIHKDGWAVCNGASIPFATYSQLYARISTTWNAATNPLTGSAQSAPANTGVNFRIPNLQGTFLRGVGDFTDNTKDTTLAGWQDSQNTSHTHATKTDSTTLRYGGTTGGSNYFSVTDIANTPGGVVTNELSGGTEARPQSVGVYYLVKLYDNLAAADVYIAPASAGTAGLVNNLAGNTAGTPILGKTDGVAIGAGYVGQVIGIYDQTATHYSATATDAGTAVTTAGTGILQSASTVPIKLSLTKGVWLIRCHGEVGQAAKTSTSTGITLIQFNLSPSTSYTGVGSGFERESRRDIVGDSVNGTNFSLNNSATVNLSADADYYLQHLTQGDATGLYIYNICMEAIRIS